MRRPPLQTLATSAAAISLILALAGGPARAQSADAEVLFEQGVGLMKDKQFAEACDAFEGSNRIEARAGTLIRLGECREKNRQLASAWSAYRDALTRAKDPAKRTIASAKIAELEKQLSYLTVSVSDEARVEGLALTRDGQVLDPALWNRATPVDGGPHTIAGKAPGHEEWRTTVTIAIGNGKTSVEVPKFKELAKLAPAPADRRRHGDGVDERDGGDEAARVDARTDSMWSPRRKIALAVAGAGVGSLGVGIAFGLSSRSKASAATSMCPDRTACESAPAAISLAREFSAPESSPD